MEAPHLTLVTLGSEAVRQVRPDVTGLSSFLYDDAAGFCDAIATAAPRVMASEGESLLPGVALGFLDGEVLGMESPLTDDTWASRMPWERFGSPAWEGLVRLSRKAQCSPAAMSVSMSHAVAEAVPSLSPVGVAYVAYGCAVGFMRGRKIRQEGAAAKRLTAEERDVHRQAADEMAQVALDATSAAMREHGAVSEEIDASEQVRVPGEVSAYASSLLSHARASGLTCSASDAEHLVAVFADGFVQGMRDVTTGTLDAGGLLDVMSGMSVGEESVSPVSDNLSLSQAIEEVSTALGPYALTETMLPVAWAIAVMEDCVKMAETATSVLKIAVSGVAYACGLRRAYGNDVHTGDSDVADVPTPS